MAVEEAEVETKQVQEEAKLKYLGFFQIAVLRAAVCLSSLYKYAKENAGPLKPNVDKLEQTMKTVVSPVYLKFDGKHLEFLHFLDRKVDDMIGKVDEYVPPTLKQRTCEVYDMANTVTSIRIGQENNQSVSEVKNARSFEFHITGNVRLPPDVQTWLSTSIYVRTE